MREKILYWYLRRVDECRAGGADLCYGGEMQLSYRNGPRASKWSSS
jgi:hypothetical protein